LSHSFLAHDPPEASRHFWNRTADSAPPPPVTSLTIHLALLLGSRRDTSSTRPQALCCSGAHCSWHISGLCPHSTPHCVPHLCRVPVEAGREPSESSFALPVCAWGGKVWAGGRHAGPDALRMATLTPLEKCHRRGLVWPLQSCRKDWQGPASASGVCSFSLNGDVDGGGTFSMTYLCLMNYMIAYSSIHYLNLNLPKIYCSVKELDDFNLQE
jgi:hypothetical protein